MHKSVFCLHGVLQATDFHTHSLAHHAVTGQSYSGTLLVPEVAPAIGCLLCNRTDGGGGKLQPVGHIWPVTAFNLNLQFVVVLSQACYTECLIAHVSSGNQKCLSAHGLCLTAAAYWLQGELFWLGVACLAHLGCSSCCLSWSPAHPLPSSKNLP